MLDVGQFMGKNAFQFVPVQDFHNSGSDGNGGMIFIPPRGEGIGRFTGNDVKPGLRYPGLRGEGLHGLMEHRRLLRADLPCGIHLQDDAVRVPVTPEIHEDGEDQGDHDAGASGDKIADQHQQTGQGGQQENDFECVHDFFFLYVFSAPVCPPAQPALIIGAPSFRGNQRIQTFSPFGTNIQRRIYSRSPKP
ncbi:MAG: hypothetical protein A4E74_02474 [Syntrophus sp. PtaB.Bin075]|nr:MAG: hypothetical protein A4E74_02474 [Syntrophus sp. PtaB.Bin075]